MTTTIASNFSSVRAKIKTAIERSGRKETDVKLLAVSKTFPATDIQEAYETGQRIFAENKVQEGLLKAPVLPKDIEWHLIGPLQRNKARKALSLFTWIHAVDSLKLAEYLNSIAQELNIKPKILFEVNIGDEETKFGFSPNSLCEAWDNLLSLKHLDIRGLMCIPPPVDSLEEARTPFRKLRELKEHLEQSSGHPLPELSMGMSHDFEAAILEGATMIRIGTALFGGRTYIQ